MIQNLHSIQPQPRATAPAVTEAAPIYYGILTDQGQALLAAAIASGTPLPLTAMAAGDGGGQPVTPLAEMTELVNEVHRAPLNQLFVDPSAPNQIVAEMVMAETVGGFWIRELGLFAESGELFAVCNTPDSYKPVLAEGAGRSLLTRMILIVSDTAAVELIINPDTVMASRAYVDAKLAEHAASRDHPAATEGAQGMIPLATQAMVDEGTDHTSAVTPQTASITFARKVHSHTPQEAGAAPLEHEHEIDDVLWLQEALDEKAEVVHQHEIGDVNGLDETLAAKHAMAQIVIQAPAGAVTGTWYPVLVYLDVGSSGTPVTIHTASGGSSLPMNCSSFAGTIGAGGWSDRGSKYSGEFFQYEPGEISLSCMTVPSESAGAVAFYVDGAAFPVTIEYRDTLPPPETGTSVVYGTSTFTPSPTPHVGAGTKTLLLASLDAGSGFYSLLQGRVYGKNSPPTAAEVGALPANGKTVDSHAGDPLVLQGSSPSLVFRESDTTKDYWIVADGYGIRLQEDNTGGPQVFSFSAQDRVLTLTSVRTSAAQGTTPDALTRKDYVDGQVSNHTHTMAQVARVNPGSGAGAASLAVNMAGKSIYHVVAILRTRPVWLTAHVTDSSVCFVNRGGENADRDYDGVLNSSFDGVTLTLSINKEFTAIWGLYY
ncbi:phage tail protein [Aeromonas sp. sia0103]|uniref:phage tail-collar fiber domain-containing protein n=1 Tax=Aeromonas sp. sia0103 TaxID=2854782 RepID=UPI001C474985|nr:phage tail protein [Aeromonas sp. sia0103]MBV7598927.1 phage tail protein [Aeromonas sp. sia0103]